MNETVIRISEDGKVMVEKSVDGLKSVKQITPDSLLECINKSLVRGKVESGLLPRGCLSFTAHDNGDKDICLLFPDDKADISYFGTEYIGFPLPRLVFGFHITKEGRVGSCRLGVVDKDDVLKPETKMFRYPFSNVSGFSLCTGNNIFPKVASLHTLGSLPYFILAMPNNNDHFSPRNNKAGLEMRDLLEVCKDKDSTYYYNDVLIPNGATLNDFITGRSI